MANINLSFVPNQRQDNGSRITAIENYLVKLNDRLDFCLNDMDNDISNIAVLSNTVSELQKSVKQLREEISNNGN